MYEYHLLLMKFTIQEFKKLALPRSCWPSVLTAPLQRLTSCYLNLAQLLTATSSEGKSYFLLQFSLLLSNLFCSWNVYHILCATKQMDMIKYLLEKLPHDVNETLLGQKSKSKWNTVCC